MLRRIEDEIRKLCKEILAGKDDQQQIQRLKELRHALHLHTERLRARAGGYPLLMERRRQMGIPPPEGTC
jgi:Mg2+ and Co2+ transporter CorA